MAGVKGLAGVTGCAFDCPDLQASFSWTRRGVTPNHPDLWLCKNGGPAGSGAEDISERGLASCGRASGGIRVEPGGTNHCFKIQGPSREPGGGWEPLALNQGLDLRHTEYCWIMKGSKEGAGVGHLRSQEGGLWSTSSWIQWGRNPPPHSPCHCRKGAKASDWPCSQDTVHAYDGEG